MKHKLQMIAMGLAIAGLAGTASAKAFVLDFEGASDWSRLLDFYNGGTDTGGRSGPNHGIRFGHNALTAVDRDAGGNGNFANEPSASTVLVFLDGSAVLNYSPGFVEGFSFFYTSRDFARVSVYSGVDLTGELLGNLWLRPQNTANGCQGDPRGGPDDPLGQFCNWDPVGVSFDGVARSIDFSGTVNQVAFDNITFGAALPILLPPVVPVPVPEPTTLSLCLVGLAAGAMVARKRKTTRVNGDNALAPKIDASRLDSERIDA